MKKTPIVCVFGILFFMTALPLSRAADSDAAGTAPAATLQETVTAPDVTPQETGAAPDTTPPETEAVPGAMPQETGAVPDIASQGTEAAPDVTAQDAGTAPAATPQEMASMEKTLQSDRLDNIEQGIAGIQESLDELTERVTDLERTVFDDGGRT